MKTKQRFKLFAITGISLIGTSPFIMAAIPAGPSAVDLGTAGDYVILAKAGISTTGVTSIIGNIGVSPNDSTSLTGFSLIIDSSNQFSTSAQITGMAFAADYTVPTPTNLTTAIDNMLTAFTDAAGRLLPDATELGAGNISGMTINPGLYKWGSNLLITSGLTLSGGPQDIWIFQIAQNLTVGNGASITLIGGAKAANIFWQVAGEATIGTTAHFEGNILCQTNIDLRTGASINGILMAQTAVTLDSNTINKPENGSGWSIGAISLNGGWKYLEWFGYFYDNDGANDQWIYHEQIGWLEAYGNSPRDIWFWSPDMGWIWTSGTTYSFFWRAHDQEWIYYTSNSNFIVVN